MNRYVTRSRSGMRTSAYQQSVSFQRRRATGSDQLSNSTVTGDDPRHRNRVTQPPPSAGTTEGAPTAAQNAELPGTPGSPNPANAS